MFTNQADVSLLSDRSGCDYRLMLFDLSVRGHHPSYIKYLIQHWCKQRLFGHLDIVVSPEFLREHTDVVALAALGRGSIKFTAITAEEQLALSSRRSGLKRLQRSFQEWHLFCKYAELLQATEGLILYFDTFQPPLVLGKKSPCPFSGIYFRPSFHYGRFKVSKPSWQSWLQKWREKWQIVQILHHPQLRKLFCLDPFAVEQLERHYATQVVHLPDPIELLNEPTSEFNTLRQSLGIEPNRQVFLLFGALTERKGVHQLLDAISMLGDDLAQQICILLVGESKLQAELEVRIKTLSQLSPVQFVRRYEFVPDQAVPSYFQLADFVLALYQQHVGMSGILLWAAAAQKPVLCSDYGLMGELTRRYRLGLIVDSTQPKEIAHGLMACLSIRPELLSDRSQMQVFAKQNTAEKFASVIFQQLQVPVEVEVAV